LVKGDLGIIIGGLLGKVKGYSGKERNGQIRFPKEVGLGFILLKGLLIGVRGLWVPYFVLRFFPFPFWREGRRNPDYLRKLEIPLFLGIRGKETEL